MGPGCDNISLWVDLVAISLACTVNSQVGVYLVSALSLYVSHTRNMLIAHLHLASKIFTLLLYGVYITVCHKFEFLALIVLSSACSKKQYWNVLLTAELFHHPPPSPIP